MARTGYDGLIDRLARPGRIHLGTVDGDKCIGWGGLSGSWMDGLADGIGQDRIEWDERW